MNRMFKLCIRLELDHMTVDDTLSYFFAKDNHHAVEVAQKLLREDKEAADFYEEDLKLDNADVRSWVVLAVNPYSEWSSQEYLIFGLDYRNFELINNCETDPSDCDYDPNCDGITPENYMGGFWERKQLTEIEEFQKYWGDEGNSLYCFHDQNKKDEKSFCVCVYIEGAGLLEGYGNNQDEALKDWKSKHGNWMK